MFSTLVLLILFFVGLGGIWLFLIGATKSHDKLVNKVKKFNEENFEEKKENV